MEEFALIQALKANKRINEIEVGNTSYLHVIQVTGNNFAFSFEVELDTDESISDILKFQELLKGRLYNVSGFYSPSSVVQSHLYLLDTTADIYSAFSVKGIATNGISTVTFAELSNKTFTDYIMEKKYYINLTDSFGYVLLDSDNKNIKVIK